MTSFKELESENEITKEELRLAVEEINRIGIVENPKLIQEKNDLHLKFLHAQEESEKRVSEIKKQSLSVEERALRLELVVNQLRYEKDQLLTENNQMRTRLDQFVAFGEDERDFVSCETQLVDFDSMSSIPTNQSSGAVPDIAELRKENDELHNTVEELVVSLEKKSEQYANLEAKFLSQSPVTLSGTYIGISAGHNAEVIQQLNDRIDYLNEKYRNLKQLHDRCGIVTDSPLVDLRESRKELNLMSSRYEKLKSENVELKRRLQSAAKSPKKKPVETTGTDSMTPRETESLKREVKKLEDDLKLRDKEIKMLRSCSKPSGKSLEVSLLEEKLRQVTQDRDELLEKLDDIDRSIEAMEVEIVRIEKENADLKREKMAKEESFVGISKQLEEVNHILNSLTDDMSGNEESERLKFKISQLETELRNKDAEILGLRTSVMNSKKSNVDENHVASLEKQIRDLEALTRSLTHSKDQLVAQLKSVQSEVNEKRMQIDQFKRMGDLSSSAKEALESEIAALKKAISSLDMERDDLQRVCDEQAEKIEVLREENMNAKRDACESNRSLNSHKQESERLQRLLEEKDLQLNRMGHLRVDLERRDVQIRSLQAELATNQREIAEVTRDNQNLAAEVCRLQRQVSSAAAQVDIESLMESLRLTENERNEVLTLYRQTMTENRAIGSNIDRLAVEKTRFEELLKSKESELHLASQTNQSLLAQCRQAELEIASLRAKVFEATRDDKNRGAIASLETQNIALNEQIKDLVALVEMERSKRGDSIPSAKLAELERTIEQQYVLIGEMDAEQARLILENSRLREGLLQK